MRTGLRIGRCFADDRFCRSIVRGQVVASHPHNARHLPNLRISTEFTFKQLSP